MIKTLEAADSDGVFMYQKPDLKWAPSTLYTWKDMIAGVQIMASEGIGKQKLYVGEGSNFKYGLVNLAAFLGQSMKETIMYNACDENNWSNPAVAKQFGGVPYTASYACGQGQQSYQDYKCSAEDDKLAGGKMACDIDLNMELRAHTQAEWYGAPPKLFCAPKSKMPKAPKWNYGSPWCPAKGGYGYKVPFPDDAPIDDYLKYVNAHGSCRDYDPVKAGGWNSCGGAGCPNSPAPVFNKTGRTDVEGCCWWGRGVIQTTGICNFGKLNYFMGARGKAEGRDVLYPTLDFCKNPEAICDPKSPPALKWIAGFFYWLNSVQSYVDKKDGWNYMSHLKNWTDAGMDLTDTSYINACSGIVNRGCYNPPCGGNAMEGGKERAANFATVIKAMKISGLFDAEAEFNEAVVAPEVETTRCGPDSPAEDCIKNTRA
jgi:predicted chitinase